MIWWVVAAWAAEPRVEARALADWGYVQGMQQVEVTLWRPLGDEDTLPAPTFPDPQVRGAIALLGTWAPPPEQRTEQGTTWLLQTRRYLVFPLEAGDLELPALTVRWDDDGWVAAQSAPVALRAVEPPGLTEGLRYVVADDVKLVRTVEGADALRVGDAFTVTDRIEASGTDSVMLFDLGVQASATLHAYPDGPALDTHVDRGRFTASRTQRTTYVAERLGTARVPGATVWWFQPSTGSWQSASTEPLKLHARLNPSLGTEAAGTVRATLAWVLRWLAILGAAWASWRWFGPRVRRMLGWRPTTSEEAQAWRAFRATAKTGAPGPTLDALYRWIGHHGHTTLHSWATAHPDVAAPQHALEHAWLTDTPFDPHPLLQAQHRARHEGSDDSLDDGTALNPHE